MIALRVLLALAGVALIVAALDAAIRTFVLPRGVPVQLSRTVFVGVRKAFDLLARPSRTYEQRDRVMALYAPIALLTLAATLVVVVWLGYTLLFVAVEDAGWTDALTTSGSSLLTLGFERPPGTPAVVLALTEALCGLMLLALVIAYLPTIYGAFSRRETAVTRLSVRAGTPPTAWELLERAHRAGYLTELDELWQQWEEWFAELSETHTSLASINFFRSPNPHRSWVTAAACVLDAAALRYAVVRVPWTPAAGVCIRSGFVALREIADFFDVEHDPDPSPGDPISIARDEFDLVYERLLAAGVPVVPDQDRAWRDYAGWRVNYDAVLVALGGLVMAPYAPWSSDRSVARRLPPLRRRRRGPRPSVPAR